MNKELRSLIDDQDKIENALESIMEFKKTNPLAHEHGQIRAITDSHQLIMALDFNIFMRAFPDIEKHLEDEVDYLKGRIKKELKNEYL